MANHDTRYQRHCELWKEHDRQIGRWILGAILFAIVLQHKVLLPFTQIPAQKQNLEARLQAVRDDLQAAARQRENLREYEGRLAEIKATIRQAPWSAERDRLRGSFADLQRSSEIVLALPYATLMARMKEAEAAVDPPAAPQFPTLPPLPGSSAADPRQSSGAIAGGMSPPGPHLNMARSAAPDASQFPPISNLPVAELPYAPGLIGPGDVRGVAPSVSLEVRAVRMLGLDREAMKQVQNQTQFAALVESQRRKQGQRLADDTVKQVAEMVDRLVIAPLEELPGDMPEVAQLRTDVEKWEQEHVGQPQWYQTVPGKGETIGFVGSQATSQTDSLLRALSGKEKAMEQRLASLAAAESAGQRDINQLDGQRDKLEARLQRLLPDWLQELVSADQMLQLYPLALLGLLAAIGVQAYLVRAHYVVVRCGHESPELSQSDPAVSSLWTLVYRGPIATPLTAGAYLGAIGVLWLHFERGCRLLSDWLAAQPSGAEDLKGLVLPGLRLGGHAMFLIAVAGIITVLHRERQNRSRSTAPVTAPRLAA